MRPHWGSVRGLLRSGDTRSSEPPSSNLGDAWSQPVSPWSGFSSTINLCRAFSAGQKRKGTSCSQAPKSSACRRSRPLARPRFSPGRAESPFPSCLAVYLRWVHGPSSETRHGSSSLARSLRRCHGPRPGDSPCVPWCGTGRMAEPNCSTFAAGSREGAGALQITAFNLGKPSPAVPCSLWLCLGSLASCLLLGFRAKAGAKPARVAFRSSSRCVMKKFLLNDFMEIVGTHVQFVVALGLTRFQG